MRILTRKVLIATALGIGTAGSLTMGLITASTPAHAQFGGVVFDPSNYSQNILTAARTLTQINNQIQSLQNEASMLINQAKNLSKIDFPQLDQLRQKLQQIDQLMGQAQGVDFRVDQLDARIRQLFPRDLDQALRMDARVRDARTRLDASMDGFRQTMTVQAQVVQNVRDDAEALTAIVARSQGAEGGLQAQQATNQLLALTAKQQFQLQQIMAAQFRTEALEQSRRAQAEIDGRAATKKFLGTGQAYTRQ